MSHYPMRMMIFVCDDCQSSISTYATDEKDAIENAARRG